MKLLIIVAINLIAVALVLGETKCAPSVTTASGTKAPKEFCSNDLIFHEEFDKLDLTTWEHENTLAGGGNWEFQWCLFKIEII
jgi:hypothetical protein